YHVPHRFELIGNSGGLITGGREREGMDQSAKGDDFQHLAGNGRLSPSVWVGQDVLDGGSDAQVRRNLGLVEVKPSELGAGERIPKFLGRGPDVDHMDML